MKHLLNILFATSLVCTSCQTVQQSSEGQGPSPVDTFQTARLYNNGLPADGCDYRIELQQDTTWVEYAPDEKSRERVATFATTQLDFSGDYHGYKEVQLKGHATNQRRSIECGWGAKKELPEITISDIRK